MRGQSGELEENLVVLISDIYLLIKTINLIQKQPWLPPKVGPCTKPLIA